MTREERAVELVRSGALDITEEGRVLRRGKRIDYESDIGYFCFKVTLDKKRVTVMVHRAVWVLANGLIPDGLEVDHDDEDKSNNRLSNLKLLTHQQNVLRSAHKWWGEARPNAKVTEADVVEIRRLSAEGVALPAIAKQFSMTVPGVWKIVKRLNWKHVA